MFVGELARDPLNANILKNCIMSNIFKKNIFDDYLCEVLGKMEDLSVVCYDEGGFFVKEADCLCDEKYSRNKHNYLINYLFLSVFELP